MMVAKGPDCPGRSIAAGSSTTGDRSQATSTAATPLPYGDTRVRASASRPDLSTDGPSDAAVLGAAPIRLVTRTRSSLIARSRTARTGSWPQARPAVPLEVDQHVADYLATPPVEWRRSAGAARAASCQSGAPRSWPSGLFGGNRTESANSGWPSDSAAAPSKSDSSRIGNESKWSDRWPPTATLPCRESSVSEGLRALGGLRRGSARNRWNLRTRPSRTNARPGVSGLPDSPWPAPCPP